MLCASGGVWGDQNNLVREMPDKFNDMIRMWDETCVNETVPNFKAEEPAALQVRVARGVVVLVLPLGGRFVFCSVLWFIR